MNLPDDKPMQNVGQVGSHNTNQTSDWTSHLAWVNAVELDVWPRNNWIVSHNFDVGAGNLEGYIRDLAAWRKKPGNQDHDLITVFIEIKSGQGWRVPDFESILLNHGLTKADMFRPMDLATWGKTQGYSGISLRTLVNTHGWPMFSHVKKKIMFVVNGVDHALDTYLAERPLVKGSAWSTNQSAWPTCFVMSSKGDSRTGYESIVVWNDEYDGWPATPTADKCLRRAYTVKSGNSEMVRGNQNVARDLMRTKKINYLCYDEVKNAFWTDLT